MMQMYNALVEVAVKDYLTDDVLDALDGFHASIGQTERGWSSAHISLPAESLSQACILAAAVVGKAFGAEPIACEVMTEAEFFAREGWDPIPELVSVTEAAAALGVSRQRVLQMIGEGKLPSTKVGREYVIPAGAL